MDRVTAYAHDVIAGKIVAGKNVVNACQRHIKDLAAASNRGFYFDIEAADHAIDFFTFIRHSTGEWGGVEFELEPWQCFIVGCIFGWKRADGMRRFRTVYIEVARKNGKTTLVAGIGLYLLICDGEMGAQIFSAATKRDQAKEIFDEATRMIKGSPALRGLVNAAKTGIYVEETYSKFVPLSAQANTLDGLNVLAALVDELHAHKTRALWDVLDTATGARRQPLMLAITTAGFDQASFCFEQRGYAESVAKGTAPDDTFFAFIACPDEGDDPFHMTTWQKANPNLGVSKKVDDLERLAAQAKAMPSAYNNFLTKHLNIWTQQADRWISLEQWDANAGVIDEDKLKGRKGYGALDLSAVSDITAWVMTFPQEEDKETLDILPRFFVPKARVYDPKNRYAAQYQKWIRAGLMTIAGEDAIDYEIVKAQILKDAQTFQIKDMNIDRLFQAHQLGNELAEEGLEVVAMGQGFLSMAAPMLEFERRLLLKKLNHGGNPVFRWMADSMAIRRDPSGNMKPDKAASQGKIDGMVALVMCIDRVTRHEKVSVYEKRGLRQL